MDVLSFLPLIGGGVVAALLLIGLLLMMSWRRVVETNTVHIVQTKGKTTSYGAGKPAGNVYYEIPAFIPAFGVTVIELPVSNFNETISNYQAYDKDRVPLSADVIAFFRIADTDKAAERISSFTDLKAQLLFVTQGAIRKVLASHDIHTIMTDRATFGKAFTDEVQAEMAAWGVECVKSLELMDIRDADGSKAIANIMAMKASSIEMESRQTVAMNKQKAETAEIENKRIVDNNKIDAQQQVDLRSQEAKQLVGIRTADQVRLTGLADEKASQEVQVEKAITTQREMETLSVDTVRRAEIAREAALIAADATKQTAIIKAEEERQATVIKAEAEASAAVREGEATVSLATASATDIRIKGEAEASAALAKGQAAAESERLLKMAVVAPELELAKGIGSTLDYQNFIVRQKEVEVQGTIGVAQAKALGDALAAADIKVIANNGNAADGLRSVGELFTSGGGLKLGSLLEGLKNMPEAALLLQQLTGAKSQEALPAPTKAKANGKSNGATDPGSH